MAQLPSTPPAPHSSVAEWGALPFAGTWAFRVNVPVFWHNMAIDPPVQDDVRIIGRIVRVAAGANTYTDTISVCGLEFPSWSHMGHRHRAVFSNDLFDLGYFPTSHATIEQVWHGPQAVALKSTTVALVAGVSADDPSNAPWSPRRGASLAPWTPVDSDLDGWPGVSAQFDAHGGYVPASADLVGNLKVPRVGLGIRLRFSHDVFAASLDHLEGKVLPTSTQHSATTGTTTDLWPDIRVLAAEVHNTKRGSVQAATPLQLDWLNCYLTPQADKAREAVIKMWRVPASFTSADIRASTE